jgi:Xaa-Pro aminopeptidase
VLDALAGSKLGDTERDIANRISNGIINNGAVGTLFLCFASGERTSQPHANATERVPKEGEIIRFDVGGTYGAFMTDFARTYSTGNPSALQRQTHRALCEAQEATIAAMKPGVLAEDVFFLCKEEFKKRGLAWQLPHIGHSFGVDDEGNFYHTEDLIVITETGNRLLTLGYAPKEIPILGQKIG